MTTFSPNIYSLLARIYASEGNRFIDRWRCCRHRIPDDVTAEDLATLSAAGLNPNAFVKLSHDNAVELLRAAAVRVDIHMAADAFVASLVSAGAMWQAALPAVVLGLAVKPHPMELAGDGAAHCSICCYQEEAHDATWIAYRMHVEGSGWGDHGGGPVVALLALDFLRACKEWPEPAALDVQALHRLCGIFRALPPTASYMEACEALAAADIFSSNVFVRSEALIHAFVSMGVFDAPESRSFAKPVCCCAAKGRRRRKQSSVPPSRPSWWSMPVAFREKVFDEFFGHCCRGDTETLGAMRRERVFVVLDSNTDTNKGTPELR